jgi:hypothetical protein
MASHSLRVQQVEFGKSLHILPGFIKPYLDEALPWTTSTMWVL